MAASAWAYETGADGIGQLRLDVPDRSANTLSAAVLTELGPVLDTIERDTAAGPGHSLRQAQRIHCRRGHQRVHAPGVGG